MVPCFGFFLIFLLSKHIFVLFMAVLSMVSLVTTSIPAASFNRQCQEPALLPFRRWFSPLVSSSGRVGLAAAIKLLLFC